MEVISKVLHLSIAECGDGDKEESISGTLFTVVNNLEICFLYLIFVVPSIMLYCSEISPTRCYNCVFILRNGFTLHVSDHALL